MRIRFLLILVALVFVSCTRTTNESRLQGDYYIKLVDFKLFNLPDSALTQIENNRINSRDSLSREEKAFNEYVDFLVKNRLLRKPFVRVRQGDGQVNMLFLEKEDYDKIQELDSNLREDGMKIVIDANVKEIKWDKGVYYVSIGPVQMHKKPGKTYWKK